VSINDSKMSLKGEPPQLPSEPSQLELQRPQGEFSWFQGGPHGSNVSLHGCRVSLHSSWVSHHGSRMSLCGYRRTSMVPGWAPSAKGWDSMASGEPPWFQGEPLWFQGKPPWLYGDPPWLQPPQLQAEPPQTNWRRDSIPSRILLIYNSAWIFSDHCQIFADYLTKHLLHCKEKNSKIFKTLLVLKVLVAINNFYAKKCFFDIKNKKLTFFGFLLWKPNKGSPSDILRRKNSWKNYFDIFF
jgi:hypothetical protein